MSLGEQYQSWASGSAEVHLHQCMQQGQQTGGAGSHNAACKPLAAITETWWDHCHNWSCAVNACKLFRQTVMKGEAVAWLSMLGSVSML